MSLTDTGYRPGCSSGQLSHQKGQVFCRSRHGRPHTHDKLVVAHRQAVFFDVVVSCVNPAGIENFKLRPDAQFLHLGPQLVQEAGMILKNITVGPVEGSRVKRAHLRTQLV